MSRAPLNNPIVPSPDNEDVYHALEALIEQLEQRADRAPKTVTIPLMAVSATTTFVVIPRVSKDGFSFGRVSFTPTADMTAHASNYWSFEFWRHRADEDGAQASRPVPSSTWNTSTVGMLAYKPKVLLLKQPILSGDVLSLVVTKAASAVTFTGTIQVQEIFGPEG